MPIHTSANRPSYSFANQGTSTANSGSTLSAGKHVLKRNEGVEFWSPSWGEETIIRIFPSFNYNDKSQFDPWRYSTKYCAFSDWIRVYEAVRNFGSPGVTMLLHDSLNNSYDSQLMNPCWILYRSINKALSSGQGMAEWFPLTKGSTGKSAVLSKPTKLFLVQCGIYRHKSKDTFSPGRPPIGMSAEGPTVVMGLPATAGESLMRLLEEKEEDWKGDPENITAQFKNGDPVGLSAGKFVHIYELGKDPRAKANLASMYTSSATRSYGADSKGYGVFLTDTLDGGPNDISAEFSTIENIVRKKIRPWDNILEFKTDVEQAHLIAPLFPPSAIVYAWRDHPDWIPESVRELGSHEIRKPVSANFNNNTPWSRPNVQHQAPVAPPVNTVSHNISEADIPNPAGMGVENGTNKSISERILEARQKMEAAELAKNQK